MYRRDAPAIDRDFLNSNCKMAHFGIITKLADTSLF